MKTLRRLLCALIGHAREYYLDETKVYKARCRHCGKLMSMHDPSDLFGW